MGWISIWWDPLFDVPPQRPGVERAIAAQRPRERPTPLGRLETLPVEMQVRASAGQPPSRVGGASPPDCHDPEQVSRIRTGSASHTGALRACTNPELRGHRPV